MVSLSGETLNFTVSVVPITSACDAIQSFQQQEDPAASSGSVFPTTGGPRSQQWLSLSNNRRTPQPAVAQSFQQQGDPAASSSGSVFPTTGPHRQRCSAVAPLTGGPLVSQSAVSFSGSTHRRGLLTALSAVLLPSPHPPPHVPNLCFFSGRRSLHYHHR